MGSTTNIILFGETGVGKSSVINLIAGKELAKVSSDAPTCTMSNTSWTLKSVYPGRTLHIWETRGLADTDISAKPPSYPLMIEQICDLTQKLADKGGVDLLLFCYRSSRITETVQRNYELFHDVLCGSEVPIVLVITNLEREPGSMEKWWEKNGSSLEESGIRVAGHACVTGLPGHSRYRESQQRMAELLKTHGHGGAKRFYRPPEDSFIEVLRAVGTSSTLKESEKNKRKAIIKVLTKRYKMDSKRATILGNELAV